MSTRTPEQIAQDIADAERGHYTDLDSARYDAAIEALLAQNEHREWGIMQRSRPGLHRGPMTDGEARQWLQEWVEDGGKIDVFYLVSRTVSEWEAD